MTQCVRKVLLDFTLACTCYVCIAGIAMGVVGVLGGWPLHRVMGLYAATVYAIALGVSVAILFMLVVQIYEITKCKVVLSA